MDDEQRSRLLALGSLNLTAETSRWMHAARTWTEAWYGVLHDSEQDFGDARRRQKGLVVERLGCETTLAEQLKERIANGIPSIGEQCSAMGHPHRATARSTSGPRTESITSSAPRQ
ncbi:hypothetical protein SNOG_08360 [Parastagonospora nodorum SN15]|uniref:Uncharacterized protein n=1 Tax=Phaeosphaeria nodorum (strain SN15 / ATCC MYA-4574 / FGSC 10173) TaxID=321614 RepID=Q0UIQ4_PHANO|nr:hypothetical protein SNOG_08360 [Parastagonospora nodorum SN15]EAT84636.1 hypothetical protein SNOG_08360 [Parastagonospora nodorum SN15]